MAAAGLMFDGLQGKLQPVFRTLRGEGRVSEEVLRAALRQIRLALLEADVHVRVVKPFLERVQAQALGQEVLQSLSPDQQVIKIVRDELVALLGGAEAGELRLEGRPAVVLLCGLQGSGKTTTAGKLGRRLRGTGQAPPAGGGRPAARRRCRATAAGGGARGPAGDGAARPARTRWRLARALSRWRATAATTWSSSTPPGACTWTSS